MTDEQKKKARKILNRLRFGESSISNSEYNFLNNLLELNEKAPLTVGKCVCGQNTNRKKQGTDIYVCVDCSH